MYVCVCHAKMPIFWLLHNLAFLWCRFSITWHWSKLDRTLANSLNVTAQAARVRSQSQSVTLAAEMATALQFKYRNYGLGSKCALELSHVRGEREQSFLFDIPKEKKHVQHISTIYQPIDKDKSTLFFISEGKNVQLFETTSNVHWALKKKKYDTQCRTDI